MLTALSLKNFIFIDVLHLDFKAGMTALTGETGAGKSILCDALWFALGAPYDKGMVQQGKSECQIEACFDISNISIIQKWLEEKGYVKASKKNASSGVCEVKRLISQKGRGQAWINQKPAKIKDLQWLKEHLVARHSQHDQQKLLTTEYQRECLDRYGGYTDLVASVAAIYSEYSELKKQQASLAETIEKQKDQLSLLQYQLEELEKAEIKPNELQELTQRQRQLSYAHQVLEKGQEALTLLHEAEPAHLMGLLHTIQQTIQKVANLDARFEPIVHTIERAHLELTEVESGLRYTLNEVIVDPVELKEVDDRLLELHNLGRKHGVEVEELPALKEKLQKEYISYENNQAALSKCEKELEDCILHYQTAAKALTEKREKAASRLSRAVTEKIETLGMPNGTFEVKLKPLLQEGLTRFGKEQIGFYLSAAKGQLLQSLTKGASGGELSRLSLVIQALVVENMPVSTLIFDEVDVGVGGSVAERMGLLLQTLGQNKQVLCITHLAQVAVLAKNHYCIEKNSQADKTVTQVLVLKNENERVKEIARMLGGIYITDKTIAYAKSMLQMD